MIINVSQHLLLGVLVKKELQDHVCLCLQLVRMSVVSYQEQVIIVVG
jgi:hypothetical protein